MNSIFIKEATDYLQGLSAINKDVKHGPNNQAFCRHKDGSQFDALRLNAGKNIVVIMSFFADGTGDVEDPRLRNTIVTRFSSYSKTVNGSDVTAAEELAMEILLDFLSRMRKDLAAGNCSWLEQVIWDELQINDIDEPWLQNHYGWDLMLPYRTHLPKYDPTKWNDEVVPE